jgi:hypothetical protein
MPVLKPTAQLLDLLLRIDIQESRMSVRSFSIGEDGESQHNGEFWAYSTPRASICHMSTIVSFRTTCM